MTDERTSPESAIGEDLDRIAWRYDVRPRGPGESDASMRKRVLRIINSDSGSAYENRMSIVELRREVRRLWDREEQFNLDLLDLPVVPSRETMRAIEHAAMSTHWPDVGAIGKRMQRDGKAIPPTCESENAAGLWSIIRGAILSAKIGHPVARPTPVVVHCNTDELETDC